MFILPLHVMLWLRCPMKRSNYEYVTFKTMYEIALTFPQLFKFHERI